MRRGEMLAIRPESLYEYGVQVLHSISSTSKDTSFKTGNAKYNIPINKEVYDLIRTIQVKSNGHLFDFNGFKPA